MLAAAAVALASCGASLSPGAGDAGRAIAQARTSATQGALYQPLAVGDVWKYTCRDIKGGGENGGNPFTIEHQVTGATTIGKTQVFAFVRQVPQVPSKPLKIHTEVMLLRNDAHGNLWIEGYLDGKTIQRVRSTLIVSHATPPKGKTFDYPGPTGATVPRFFYGIVPTNPTPLGTFTVADYEESQTLHDYGYAQGMGIAEEDHGPNFEVDCLINYVQVK